jgi:hypothetical protein
MIREEVRVIVFSPLPCVYALSECYIDQCYIDYTEKTFRVQDSVLIGGTCQSGFMAVLARVGNAVDDPLSCILPEECTCLG